MCPRVDKPAGVNCLDDTVHQGTRFPEEPLGVFNKLIIYSPASSTLIPLNQTLERKLSNYFRSRSLLDLK